MSDVEIPKGTVKLLDKEARDAKEHRERISRVVLEVEQILLREKLTVGDFLEIVNMFTARANKVFENITIKEVKESYDRSS